jgi:hypothetical protein
VTLKQFHARRRLIQARASALLSRRPSGERPPIDWDELRQIDRDETVGEDGKASPGA